MRNGIKIRIFLTDLWYPAVQTSGDPLGPNKHPRDPQDMQQDMSYFNSLSLNNPFFSFWKNQDSPSLEKSIFLGGILGYILVYRKSITVYLRQPHFKNVISGPGKVI